MDCVQLKTSCKGCVFASKLENGTQLGCTLGKLERFNELGTDISFDGEAYTINGRVCNYCRNEASDWAKSLDPRDYHNKVEDEVRRNIEAIVIIKDAASLPDILKTAQSLSMGTWLKFSKVHFVLNTDNISFVELLQKLEVDKRSNWFVTNMLERREGDVSDGRCIDVIAGKMEQCDYYAVFYPGFVVPQDYLGCMNNALNVKLDQFVMLTPNKDNQGLTVLTHLHRKLQGNLPTLDGHNSLRDKIESLTGSEKLIRKVEDVCPAFAA